MDPLSRQKDSNQRIPNIAHWRQRKSHGEPWHILSSETPRQIGIYGCKTNTWLGYPNSSVNSPSWNPNFLYSALGAIPFSSFSRNVDTVISRLLSNSFSAFLKRIEAIPCFRCSESTAIQQIMFFLCEKRRTPMIVPRLLTHNACFLFMNFSTVCSCSYIHSSVSSPGKFSLTFLTSCIHESIQELSPNTASISLPRKLLFIDEIIISQNRDQVNPYPVNDRKYSFYIAKCLSAKRLAFLFAERIDNRWMQLFQMATICDVKR